MMSKMISSGVLFLPLLQVYFPLTSPGYLLLLVGVAGPTWAALLVSSLVVITSIMLKRYFFELAVGRVPLK